MALPATCPHSLSCQTPPGGMTPAWKVAAAIRPATTKRTLRASLGESRPSSYWKYLNQLLPVLEEGLPIFLILQ
ncbi:hypothetical protein ES332_A11G086700v1 [Gossypium tomentosum]|uniref:Uncharacterized protein n=1 Tax=Gossypium tomentosum TaxID=34277 RepID=A0A5D2N709_GOSTO|nr:hypothetical protein ES332_A11G086700v1 [Gossypium tomentosum]